MLDKMLDNIRPLIPHKVFATLQRPYHWTLALLAVCWYRSPSRQIKIIAVTGTKGKSSTTEILNAILEEAGHKTALSNTIRFKVGDASERNLYKMSMPGRFATQKLIRRAVTEGCTHLIIEITSQGALMFRHRFIELDTLIFTNISPEHIEAHGSYDNYLSSKLAIAKNMRRSSKPMKIIIVNANDKEAWRFLECKADKKISYGIKDAEPYKVKQTGLEFSYGGKVLHSPLSGIFNLYNILAAATCAKEEGVPVGAIAKTIASFSEIPGRIEKIDAGQGFEVIVDYAHTPDSLEKLYKVFRPDPADKGGRRLIAVLGGTGGGRDAWKRQEMGRLAEMYCDQIILTNEDPYDEDPQKIVNDVATGITSKKPTVIMDRREAIHEAIKNAKSGDAVLIIGKGTDPYIMGPNGTKTPWSDASVAREELAKLQG